MGNDLRIAILGWGSLVGVTEDHLGYLKNRVRGEWVREGPALPIEFARVSDTRHRALTLVIDRDHGQENQVWYIESTRKDPRDAACDLRVREGTTTENIGLICLKQRVVRSGQGGDRRTEEVIAQWARERSLDAVTWTDLRTNFQKEVGQPLSVQTALDHLRHRLTRDGRDAAVKYVEHLVPLAVETPLRTALRASPWWASRSWLDQR
jgi:hypothetical protein